PSARQADLAGARTRPQKPKRPQAQPGPAEGRATPARWLDPRPDVGLGNLGGLLVGQERQQIGKAAGQHRLAGARRPEKEQGVLPGGGDLEDAFGRLVPPDLREVWPVWELVWGTLRRDRHLYHSPLSFRDTQRSQPPRIRWSRSSIPRISPASAILRVNSKSSALGSGLPLGCVWNRTTPAAPQRSACFRISRGSTAARARVPRKISRSAIRRRWRSRKRGPKTSWSRR